MRIHKSFSGRVPALFASVMLVFILVLAWLGWTLIEQDAELINQRKRDLVEASAVETVSVITSHIDAEKSLLDDLIQSEFGDSETSRTAESNLKRGRVTILFDSEGMRAWPDSTLRYHPWLPSPEPTDQRLLETDRLEFSRRDSEGASVLLLKLVNDPDHSVRAGALVRLARIYRRENRLDEALVLYGELARIAGSEVDGVPAPLLAAFGTCSIQESAGNGELLKRESERLAELLSTGAYPLDRTTYRFYAQSALDWLSATDGTSDLSVGAEISQQHPLSEAAIQLSQIRDLWRSGAEPSSGIRSSRIDTVLFVLQWAASGDRFVGMIADEPFGGGSFRESFEASFRETGIGRSITDDSGNIVLAIGEPNGVIQGTRTLASAGQTWTIAAFETETFEVEAENRRRRGLLLSSLLLVIFIVATSTYFLARALNRELAVAQLQSDFVSAVSHEFRTPLTSMRQMTEMLASGRVTSTERIQDYYGVIEKESRRLSRLVESLLNFGRLEAGEFHVHYEAMAIGDLAENTAIEFRQENSMEENRLICSIDANPVCPTDRETIKLAIWNLLDNALKYGGASPMIHLDVSEEDGSARIAVSDNGPGIHALDRERVFEKFVRGSNKSATHNVKGTGLGLALVKKIVEAHGGEIRLTSEIGAGSTFILTIPLGGES